MIPRPLIERFIDIPTGQAAMMQPKLARWFSHSFHPEWIAGRSGVLIAGTSSLRSSPERLAKAGSAGAGCGLLLGRSTALVPR